jgi:phosphopantothenate synthetase
LEVNLDAVKRNLERWKQILAEEMAAKGEEEVIGKDDEKVDIPMTEQAKDDDSDDEKK